MGLDDPQATQVLSLEIPSVEVPVDLLGASIELLGALQVPPLVGHQAEVVVEGRDPGRGLAPPRGDFPGLAQQGLGLREPAAFSMGGSEVDQGSGQGAAAGSLLPADGQSRFVMGCHGLAVAVGAQRQGQQRAFRQTAAEDLDRLAQVTAGLFELSQAVELGPGAVEHPSAVLVAVFASQRFGLFQRRAGRLEIALAELATQDLEVPPDRGSSESAGGGPVSSPMPGGEPFSVRSFAQEAASFIEVEQVAGQCGPCLESPPVVGDPSDHAFTFSCGLDSQEALGSPLKLGQEQVEGVRELGPGRFVSGRETPADQPVTGCEARRGRRTPRLYLYDHQAGRLGGGVQAGEGARYQESRQGRKFHRSPGPAPSAGPTIRRA